MIPFEKTETILFNGKIITLDPKDTIAAAVAIKKGRILSVGSDEEVLNLAGGESDLIDLKGKTVLPGFIDSHCHAGRTSTSFGYYVNGRCPPNKSINDILGRIKKRTTETPAGEWIIVHGSTFIQLKLNEKRYPTREELDSVSPEHPVIFMASLHSVIANSYALKLANIRKGGPPLRGGAHIEVDEVTGEPTGVLKEALAQLPIPPFSYDTLKSAIQAGFPKYWVEQGFTSAYSFAEAAEIKIYQELFQNGTLPMRIQVMVHNSSNTPEPLECLMKLGILPGLMGNDWLKMGGVKIFLDGAFMALTAASNQPYLNLPEKNYHGILRLEPNFFKELVRKAHDGGLQICVHAMGDKAQDLALDAYENALRSNPRSHRHRIEHFGCDMGSPQQRRRARELGIVPVTTIGWLYAYGDFIETYLGPQRKEQSFALRSMHDDGLKPANASDQCGTEPVTLDPFFSIWCAVTRQTFFGKQFVPGESISVNEALRMWTTNAAYSGFEEHIKGSLEPGKFADMIVISHDILSVPEDRIKEIKVDMTIIDGKIVYERQQI